MPAASFATSGADKFRGLGWSSGATGSPILADVLAWVDCRVHTSLDLGDHTLFVGQVVDAGFAKPEDTPVLRMEDTRMNYGG